MQCPGPTSGSHLATIEASPLSSPLHAVDPPEMERRSHLGWERSHPPPLQLVAPAPAPAPAVVVYVSPYLNETETVRPLPGCRLKWDLRGRQCRIALSTR